jgi:hypothetical protein
LVDAGLGWFAGNGVAVGADFWAAGFPVAVGRGDGVAVLAAEFATGVGVAVFLLAVVALAELGEGAVRALDELEFLFVVAGVAVRLLAFEFRFESGAAVFRVSRAEFEVTDEFAPGTVKTTSSLFDRCSTRAVAPGSSRKETSVLSPLRWALTSANPRPRRASVRGTSAAGILM